MDRLEAVLLVAETALKESRELRAQIEILKSAPKRADSFCVDDAGELIFTDENGEAKSLGRVRGNDCNYSEVKEMVACALDVPPLPEAKVELNLSDDGELIQTLSDGSIKNLGLVRGKDAPALDMGAVSLVAEALVEEAVSKIPMPPAGKDGDKGDSITGPSGESAYDIAVRNGFRGGEKEWLEHLVGDPGRDGRDSVGAKGDDGEPGRDGADIDGIDLIEKDNGVRVLVLKQGDRRRELTFRVTEHVHKGAYKSDQTYYRGNEVQAGGSMFTARVDNPKGTPGNSDDWILTAKRGQNGRDLRSGERDTSKPYKLGDRS